MKLARYLVRPVVRRLRPERTALENMQIVVDGPWYLKVYPDVAASGLSPVDHFIQRGAWEGRRPNRFFDPIWYTQRYPDAAGQLPILHYALTGRSKRYDPGPLFSSSAYLAAYPDVEANGIDPLDHYIRHGQHEQRVIVPVDPTAVLSEWSTGRQRKIPSLNEDELPGNETLERVLEIFGRRGTAVEP